MLAISSPTWHNLHMESFEEHKCTQILPMTTKYLLFYFLVGAMLRVCAIIQYQALLPTVYLHNQGTKTYISFYWGRVGCRFFISISRQDETVPIQEYPNKLHSSISPKRISHEQEVKSLKTKH